MEQRLQKLISAAGIASRRQAESLLAAGRVTVNGRAAAVGDKADPEKDDIRLDGCPLTRPREHTYVMLNKPVGYVTTCRDEKGRPTVLELVADLGVRVYPVGRLDLNSRGLLLLTDDGETANRLMHPSHAVEKTYRLRVRGLEDRPEALEQLRAPIRLEEGIRVRAVSVVPRGQDGLDITITQGRKRQVRRMCAAVGLQVLDLCRIREGELSLGTLPSGKWRHLQPEERRYLQTLCAETCKKPG